MKKICVYAIAKNESQFVERWYNSVKEADLVIVGDTGSTDDTINKLKELGVKTYKIKIDPWRFDKARNEVLKHIPKNIDICVSMDLDEVITPGWRDKMEEAWKEGTTKLKYNYNWSFDQYGKPAVCFLIEKAHSRNNYRWVHPVHEILEYTGDDIEKIDFANGFEVNHYPDHLKSRSNYLPLLELSVKEDPDDDRNMHYLGREYMYNKRWDEAIEILQKHLMLKKATWQDERCASMRYISRCYKNKNNHYEARLWLYKAIAEAPYTREPYVEMALLEYEQQNWIAIYHMCLEALKIKQKSMSYINEAFCWNETIFDLASISCYNLGLFDKALDYSNEALKLNPNDERIVMNNNFFKKIIDRKENDQQ